MDFFFLAVFAATALKVSLLLCKDLINLSRVTPLELRRIEEFFSFLDFFCHLCSYRIETWFIAL
jgi:hypothetical protein